jgi:predicted transcriptional regulator
MTQMTIEVPDDVAERVKAAAVERGVAAEELAGEAVAEKFPPRRKLGFASLGRSNSGRAASEDETMLAEGFGR